MIRVITNIIPNQQQQDMNDQYHFTSTTIIKLKFSDEDHYSLCYINKSIIDSMMHYDSFYESLINVIAKF